jgi:phage gp29-like protein
MADKTTAIAPGIGAPIQQEIATIRKDIDIFAGYLVRLENPDPVVLSKGNGKGLKLYDDVIRDPQVASVLQTRIMAVTGREWEIVPPDDVPADDKAIEKFLRKTLFGTNFDQARQEMMRAIVYGFYPAEILWKPSGGNWVIDCIIPKHPRRFCFTPDRKMRLLTPYNLVEGEALPDRKFVLMTYGSQDNPYGCGLGQVLWWPVWFKKHGIKFWMVYLEKFGMPTVKGAYPSGSSLEQQQKLLAAIDAFQTDTGVIVPDTMQIELIEASRTGNAGYQGLCDYMDKAISKAVVGQTLTSDVQGKGSYAAAKTHNEIRIEVVKSDADWICETLNKTLIRWLVDLNFGPQEEYPKIWIRTDAEQDLKPLADRDKVLYDMGLPIPKSYLYETYGIPAPDTDEEALTATSSAGATHGAAGLLPSGNADTASSGDLPLTANGRQFAESKLFPDQVAIDRMDPSGTGGRPSGSASSGVFGGMLRPVMDLIRQGDSYQEIENHLLETYPEMNFKEVETLIERAIFVSECWGRLNA